VKNQAKSWKSGKTKFENLGFFCFDQLFFVLIFLQVRTSRTSAVAMETKVISHDEHLGVEEKLEK
jgi:hypothetical protein